MKPREAKYLGAFLHDIGKFTYRTVDYKIDHETLGVDFFRTHLSNSKLFKYDFEIIDKISDYIKRGLESIRIADYEGAKEREETARSSRYTRRPLVSIFQRVSLGKEDTSNSIQNTYYGTKETYYYNPDPIQSDKILSSLEKVQENVITWELTKENEIRFIHFHKVGYNAFLKDLQILKPIGNFRAYFTTLYKVFEKYTSRVSSASYASVPDISLFDHSRVVAALSICLDEGDYDNECLLIKGDLSGIQNFIYYQIEEAEKASKQLRGRSFYVRILIDTLANYLTRELEVYDANILMSSGGHFLLLVPNNQSNRNKLIGIERKINRMLLKNFGGILQLILAYTTVSGTSIMEDFPDVYNQLESQLVYEKRKKSFSILEDLMLEPKEAQESDKFENLFIEIGGKLVQSDFLLEVTFQSQDKSGYLGNLDRVLVDFSEFGCCYLFAKSQDLNDVLELLQQHSFDYLIIHNIKNTDFEYLKNSSKNLEKFSNIGFSFKLVGSFIPSENFRPLSFEELARLEPLQANSVEQTKENPNSGREKEKYPLLGVARMDVDNLGEIFAKGLKTGKSEKDESKLFSISRLATLSRELDLFFNGYINRLAQKHYVYLVYSGGDDLFAVGSWENIIEFVLELRKKFQKFTCNNPYFTISCGIVFVKPSYPAKRFAQDSKEELDKAKNFVDQGKKEQFPQKNKVTIFERVVEWKEFERLLNIGKSLTRILLSDNINEKKLSRSFIYKLLTLTQECFDEKGNLIPDSVYKVMPRLHYYFARRDVNSKALDDVNFKLLDKDLRTKVEYSPEKISKDEDIKNYLRVLAKYFISSEEDERKRWFRNFVIPASYILLKTRKVKQ